MFSFLSRCTVLLVAIQVSLCRSEASPMGNWNEKGNWEQTNWEETVDTGDWNEKKAEYWVEKTEKGHWEEKEKENLEETTSKPIERAEEVTISYDDVVTEYEEIIPDTADGATWDEQEIDAWVKKEEEEEKDDKEELGIWNELMDWKAKIDWRRQGISRVLEKNITSDENRAIKTNHTEDFCEEDIYPEEEGLAFDEFENNTRSNVIDTDGDCKISKQCKGLTVCAKNNRCKRIPCTTSDICKMESNLPSKCESILPGQAFCSQTNCEQDVDCGNAGTDTLSFGCYSDEQCKPAFGECESSCDCVDNYGMRKGEAKCYRNKCYCRSETLATCFDGEVPTTTTPTTTTQEPEKRSSGISGQCPVPVTIPQVKKGEQCRVHSACIQWGGNVCAKPKGAELGTCNDIKCKDDSECKSETDLPLKCMGGWCRRTACAKNKDCPEGYGCFKDNQCKKMLSDCKYDCDCSSCPGIQCFKEKCFCMNDADDCSDIPITPATSLSRHKRGVTEAEHCKKNKEKPSF